MNVKFEYLYRDASNYKNWGEVIFSNKCGLEIKVIEIQIENDLVDNQFFIAEQLDLPVLYFDKYDLEMDHSWHEFSSISECENRSNDMKDRDIREIIELLKCNVNS